MSFAGDARRVRDEKYALHVRFRSLRACVGYPSVGHGQVLDALQIAVGAGNEPWTDAQLRGAIDLLESWRDEWKVINQEVAERRRAEKRIGLPYQADARADDERRRAAVGPGFQARPTYEERQASLRRADCFPARLGPDLDAVRAAIDPMGSTLTDGFDALVGEWVRIPRRIVVPEPDPRSIATLTNRQRLMAHCLLTRNPDGYVRARHLEPLLRADDRWIVPYVVALLGDYVVEIVEAAWRGLVATWLEHPTILHEYWYFAGDNGAFIRRVEQQATSYHDCFHRDAYASAPGAVDVGGRPRPRYPAFDLIDVLRGRRPVGAVAVDAIVPAEAHVTHIRSEPDPDLTTG